MELLTVPLVVLLVSLVGIGLLDAWRRRRRRHQAAARLAEEQRVAQRAAIRKLHADQKRRVEERLGRPEKGRVR